MPCAGDVAEGVDDKCRVAFFERGLEVGSHILFAFEVFRGVVRFALGLCHVGLLQSVSHGIHTGNRFSLANCSVFCARGGWMPLRFCRERPTALVA